MECARRRKKLPTLSLLLHFYFVPARRTDGDGEPSGYQYRELSERQTFANTFPRQGFFRISLSALAFFFFFLLDELWRARLWAFLNFITRVSAGSFNEIALWGGGGMARHVFNLIVGTRVFVASGGGMIIIY